MFILLGRDTPILFVQPRRSEPPPKRQDGDDLGKSQRIAPGEAGQRMRPGNDPRWRRRDEQQQPFANANTGTHELKPKRLSTCSLYPTKLAGFYAELRPMQAEHDMSARTAFTIAGGAQCRDGDHAQPPVKSVKMRLN